MSTLLVWREKLQRIYALYSIYIQKGLQFVTGLVLFWVINSNIGFMKPASSVFCTLGLAVICTFLPMTITVLAATALILAHFYALSLPIALVALVIFILMYIFYFRFTPKKAWLVLISGLAFSLKIPFVIPIAFGLLGSPVWIVPASCGIITYYMTDYVKVSAAALKEADASGIAANLMSFTKQVLASKEMWLMVMAVTIGILVVNFVRTRGVDHSWKIASAAGAAVTVAGSASALTLYVPETEVPIERPRILRLLDSNLNVPSSLNSTVTLFCSSLHFPTISLSSFAVQPAKAQTSIATAMTRAVSLRVFFMSYYHPFGFS